MIRRPITDVLRDIRKGRVVEAATDELAAIVRDVMDTGLKGELTIKITVKPQEKGDNCLILAAKVSSKRPMAPLPEGLFFADHDGALLRDDPTQLRIFADARERIDPETGEILVDNRRN